MPARAQQSDVRVRHRLHAQPLFGIARLGNAKTPREVIEAERCMPISRARDGGPSDRVARQPGGDPRQRLPRPCQQLEDGRRRREAVAGGPNRREHDAAVALPRQIAPAFGERAHQMKLTGRHDANGAPVAGHQVVDHPARVRALHDGPGATSPDREG